MQIMWTQGDVQHFSNLTPPQKKQTKNKQKRPPENNLFLTHHCAFMKITVNLPYVL